MFVDMSKQSLDGLIAIFGDCLIEIKKDIEGNRENRENSMLSDLDMTFAEYMEGKGSEAEDILQEIRNFLIGSDGSEVTL